MQEDEVIEQKEQQNEEPQVNEQEEQIPDEREEEQEQLLPEIEAVITKVEFQKASTDISTAEELILMSSTNRITPVLEGVIHELNRRKKHLLKLKGRLESTAYKKESKLNKSRFKQTDEENPDDNAGKMEIKERTMVDRCQQTILAIDSKIELLRDSVLKGYREVELAEEGIFVANKPPMFDCFKTTLEHRLLREDDGLDLYFDENCHIIAEADPTKRTFMKPNSDIFLFSTEENRVELKKTILAKSVQSSGMLKLYKLDIDIHDLEFENHSLMCEEEYFCSQINSLFKTYTTLKESAMPVYYQKKIAALVDELKKHRKLKSLSTTGQLAMTITIMTSSEREREMQRIRNELKKLRQLLEVEEKKMITCVNKISLMWKRVKDIRSRSKVIVTPLKVVFHKIAKNEEADQEAIEEQVREEIMELEEDNYWEYSQTLAEYSEHNLIEDEATIIRNRPVVKELDLEAIEQSIRSRIMSSRRMPGESIIEPQLSKCELTKEEDLPKMEKERRRLIQNLEYYVEVYVNDSFVSRTKAQHLRSNFTVKFKEIISTCVLKWPDSVSVKIVRKSLVRKEVAVMYVSVPNQRESQNEESTEQSINFTDMNHLVSLYDNTVDSKDVVKQNIGYLSGKLGLSMNWASVAKGKPPEIPPVPSSQEDRNILPNSRDLLQIGKMMQWMEQNNIDPNDPELSGLLVSLELLHNKNYSSKGFHLTEPDDKIFMSGFNDVAYQRRIHLLQLRNKHGEKVPFQSPLTESEVTAKMLTSYESAIRMATKQRGLSQFKQKIRSELKDEYNAPKRLEKRTVNVRKYVREVNLPEFNSSFSWISRFFSEKRPLKPEKREVVQVEPTDISECKISIQIIQAYNVPVRKIEQEKDAYRNYRTMRMRQEENKGLAARTRANTDIADEEEEKEQKDEEEKDPDEEEQDGKEKELEPGNFVVPEVLDQVIETSNDRVMSYISVTFQKYNKKTKVVEGPNPQFNQSIELPIHPPNEDFSQDNLIWFDEQIYFDLFDELNIDNLKDDRRFNLINQRSEFRWLGSISLPFQTLYNNGKIVGAFRLNTPPVHLGYELQSAEPPTTLTLSLTLDPPLARQSGTESLMASDEPPEIYYYANWWQKTIGRKTVTKDRYISALVPNNSGKATLSLRYVKAQKPPDDIDTESKALRFVSLLPFIEDYQLQDHFRDFWMDSQTFLDLKAGDGEEHALLFCNYLKYLRPNAKVYIVLGKGVPEGRTAYVLVEDTNENRENKDSVAYQHNGNKRFKLYNAARGEVYDAFDPLCPLTEIGMVMNETNLWACILADARPSHKNFTFEFSNRSAWYPLVSGSNNPIAKAMELQSVQVPILRYQPTSIFYSEKLKDNITRSLRSSIVKWRERQGTDWNLEISRQLSEILPIFEVAKQNDTELNRKEHDLALKKITDQYLVIGFPMNFSFTDVRSILREVYNTMIHENDERGVQFGLAVHVYPYCNNVCSVWLYLVSVVGKH